LAVHEQGEYPLHGFHDIGALKHPFEMVTMQAGATATSTVNGALQEISKIRQFGYKKGSIVRQGVEVTYLSVGWGELILEFLEGFLRRLTHRIITSKCRCRPADTVAPPEEGFGASDGIGIYIKTTSILSTMTTIDTIFACVLVYLACEVCVAFFTPPVWLLERTADTEPSL